MEDFGRFWRTLKGFGRLWKDLGGFGRLRKLQEDSRRFFKVLVGSKR